MLYIIHCKNDLRDLRIKGQPAHSTQKMSFSNLTASCAGAMRIFAERDAVELKRKAVKLELELYHARLPPLSQVMRDFNLYHEERDCRCDMCYEGKRCWPDLGEEDIWEDGIECKFISRWNAFLDSIGASIEVGRKRPVNLIEHHCESDSAIFTNDRSKWTSRFSEWGKPLFHISKDPRRAIWDTLVKKVDMHWKHVPLEGVVKDCDGNCRFGDTDSGYLNSGQGTYDGSRCRCNRCVCGRWIPTDYFMIHGGQCGTCASEAWMDE